MNELTVAMANRAAARLEDIHASLKFVGPLDHEFDEQVMAVMYVRPDARVLELGGNIGRNSCVIASLLRDSSNLVVFESDAEVATRLTQNRDLNGFTFTVIPKALSKRPLMQRGWDTIPCDGNVPEGWTRIDTIDWDTFRETHGTFDTLVADCEGALFYIMRDYPDFIKQFTTIIIENDFQSLDQKLFVETMFRAAGFMCVYTKGHDGFWGSWRNHFFRAWIHKPDVLDV